MAEGQSVAWLSAWAGKFALVRGGQGKKKKKPTPSLATTDWLEGRFVTPPVSRFRLESWNWSKCSRPVVVGVGR